jgi:hypothetical protein
MGRPPHRRTRGAQIEKPLEVGSSRRRVTVSFRLHECRLPFTDSEQANDDLAFARDDRRSPPVCFVERKGISTIRQICCQRQPSDRNLSRCDIHPHDRRLVEVRDLSIGL